MEHLVPPAAAGAAGIGASTGRTEVRMGGGGGVVLGFEDLEKELEMLRLRRRLLSVSDGTVMIILLAFFAGAIFGSASAHARAGSVNWWAWMDGFWQHFGTEVFGAFLTFLLIGILIDTRRKRDDLIRQMGSRGNDMALSAVDELRKQQWLEDGTLMHARLGHANLERADLGSAKLEWVNLPSASLRGARLNSANLAGAVFWHANLEEAKLVFTNLPGADFREANLAGANLLRANLTQANMEGASLTQAKLWKTNLEWVNLEGASLEGADLRDANLAGANLLRASLTGAQSTTPTQLQHVKTLQGAVLPDGTKLPNDDTWRDAFEKWCEIVETDEKGYIKVADPSSNDADIPE